MTDARKEAIETVEELLRGKVERTVSIEGWERAIVRGRLLKKSSVALSGVLESMGPHTRKLCGELLAEIRAEVEERDGK